MLGYIDLLLLFTAHFVGDFLFQWREMAQLKSESYRTLWVHCVIYGLPFLIFGWKFYLLAVVTHFPVDAVSSQYTKEFHRTKREWKFYTTIGADQMVHFMVLTSILYLLGGW